MQADSLDQHRRELDATFETLRSLREHAHTAAAVDVNLWNAVAELRDELHAVANRVESLTRSLGDDGREHSVRADASFYPAFCQVCGQHWESAAAPHVCPECSADGPDVVVGPLATVVRG